MPWHRHCRSGAGLHLGDNPGSHRGPDDVVAAVVLDAATVEALHIDCVGNSDGRLQFGAAGNTTGHGFHLRVISGVARIVAKAPTNPFCPFPGIAARPWNGIDWYAMESVALDTNPTRMHSNGQEWILMHWLR